MLFDIFSWHFLLFIFWCDVSIFIDTADDISFSLRENVSFLFFHFFHFISISSLFISLLRNIDYFHDVPSFSFLFDVFHWFSSFLTFLADIISLFLMISFRLLHFRCHFRHFLSSHFRWVSSFISDTNIISLLFHFFSAIFDWLMRLRLIISRHFISFVWLFSFDWCKHYFQTLWNIFDVFITDFHYHWHFVASSSSTFLDFISFDDLCRLMLIVSLFDVVYHYCKHFHAASLILRFLCEWLLLSSSKTHFLCQMIFFDRRLFHFLLHAFFRGECGFQGFQFHWHFRRCRVAFFVAAVCLIDAMPAFFLPIFADDFRLFRLLFGFHFRHFCHFHFSSRFFSRAFLIISFVDYFSRL